MTRKRKTKYDLVIPQNKIERDRNAFGIYRLTDKGSCYHPIQPVYAACYRSDNRHTKMRAVQKLHHCKKSLSVLFVVVLRCSSPYHNICASMNTGQTLPVSYLSELDTSCSFCYAYFVSLGSHRSTYA